MLFALIDGQKQQEVAQMEELRELHSGDPYLAIPLPDLDAVFDDPLLVAVIAGAEQVEAGTGGEPACEEDIEVLEGLLEELAECRAKNAAIAGAIEGIEERRWLGDNENENQEDDDDDDGVKE